MSDDYSTSPMDRFPKPPGEKPEGVFCEKCGDELTLRQLEAWNPLHPALCADCASHIK